VIASEHRRIDFLRWSPEGRIIVGRMAGLVSAAQPEGMILIAPDGSSRKRMVTPAGGFFTSAPAWVGPDEILYEQSLAVVGGTSVPAGGGRLVKQNIRSGKWKVLLEVPEAALTVDVSGSGIVFMDAMSPRQNLIELPMSDKPASARSMMPGTAQDRQPVYSPDGESIMFASNRSGNSDLWKFSTRTGELRRLTDDPGHEWDPAFTPDGRFIVWSSNRSGNFEIWTADADGAGPRKVTHDGYEAENPNPTRDGWVYYVSGNPSQPGLWKIQLDGSAATPVVEGRLIYPDISPDGQFLASDRELGTKVVRLADGQIFSAGLDNGASRTRWTADGRSLIFPVLGTLRKAGEGHGLLLQEFAPGQDVRATRRRL
jgi:dipeptidyl aminopeptidase/acylaminoacyl peptidase